MTGLMAMLHREARLRATNATFIFWDVVYPLGYLLVFGVGMSSALGDNFAGLGAGYSDFFLAGVLGMASFGIASNTAWSLFMDRDNGIFYEMLTYPLSRAAYLVGKVLFNRLIWCRGSCSSCSRRYASAPHCGRCAGRSRPRQESLLDEEWQHPADGIAQRHVRDPIERRRLRIDDDE